MSNLGGSPLLADSIAPKHPSRESIQESIESTPLLSSSGTTPRYDGEHDQPGNYDAASIVSRGSDASSLSGKRGRRWPSIVAMVLLAVISVGIIVLAFFVPAAVEEYAKQAFVVEPTNLSLDSITSNGVRARIQANLRLEGQRVQNDNVRRVGRFTTWIIRELGTEETAISVYLPAYDGALLGEASIPPLKVSLVDGQTTSVDFVADLVPGDAEAFRYLANDWLDGKLDTLRVQAKADIPLRSGIVPLGTHSVIESLTFEAKSVPELPQYNITRLEFKETPLPGSHKTAMAANVSVTAFNKFPITLDTPPLGFEIFVAGCGVIDPYILVANAEVGTIKVRPDSDVIAEVHSLVRDIPEPLTRICPNSKSSPLDVLLKQYMGGKTATVFVRGKKVPGSDIPNWMAEILSSITVPVDFPGRSLDGMIRNFSLTDVHLTMPNPEAEPGTPGSNPKVSGTVQVLAAIPSEMSFQVHVTSVRALADVFYGSKKLGELDLRQWRDANSTRVEATKKHEAMLKIQSRIDDAPLNVTDGDVLTDVIQTLLFSSKQVLLNVKAHVDVKVQTVLGPLVLKDVPAEGKVPLKPLPKNLFGGLAPKLDDIEVVDSTPSSVELEALVNVTNLTPYTAHIPSISLHLLSNGSIIGEVRGRNLDITVGNNSNLSVSAVWYPSMGGAEGVKRGRELLSQYISGFNTSVTLRSHRLSIPAQPLIGEALSKINLTVPTPRLGLSGNDDDDDDEGNDTHFIRDATFHIFSSTAAFTLLSPLQHNTLYIDHINATAFYNHTEAVGRIEYEYPFAVPPGTSQTPKLPVDWSLDSVGYEKLRQALGGQLKLDAKAVVGVRLGSWTESVWYEGKGIGAGVRL